MSIEISTQDQLVRALDHDTRADAVSVIKFYYEWCGHCKHIAPVYERVARAVHKGLPNVRFYSVNIEQHPAVAQEAFQVRAGPTFKVLRKGRTVSTVEGADIQRVLEHIDAALSR